MADRIGRRASGEFFFGGRVPIRWQGACSPAAKQELKASSAAMQQVNESPPFPKVPLFVLTGTNKPLEKAQFKQVWLETQNDLATLSPIAKHVVCDQCGHYVQRDDSTAVIDAIQPDAKLRSRRAIICPTDQHNTTCNQQQAYIGNLVEVNRN